MANISEYISKIRTAIYGKDVRSSLADGLDAVNKETEAATALSQEIDQRQTSIEKQFDDQIANMTLDDPSSAELVAGRTNVNTGKNYDTIGRRLDAEHADVTAQLAETATNMDDRGVNVLYPPVPLVGAKGDGVTDDTKIIQNILNAYPKIFIPDGSYVIGNITVPSDANISISQRATLKLKDGTNNSMFTGTGVTNVEIRGGIFDGNKTNNATAKSLFFFTGCDRVTIKDLEIKNTTRHAILSIDTSNIKILNIKGDNIFGSGFLITPQTKDVDNVLIRDCVLTNVTQEDLHYGVYFNSGDVYIVKNSTIENVVIDGAYYGGIFPGGDNNQVINCTAKNCANWRGMWIHDSRNIKVIGGNYSNNGRDGIYVQKAHDVDIFSPTCENNANNGLGIDSDHIAAGRLQGTNTNKSVRVLGGVYRNNSQGSSTTYSGIRIGSISGGMVDVTVIGTICIDDQVTPKQKRGIESAGSGSGHIIEGNVSRGSVEEGIYVPDAITISGNIVDGSPSKYNKPVGVVTGTAKPSTIPIYVGQQFIDTTNKKAYVATGTSSSSDWTVLN